MTEKLCKHCLKHGCCKECKIIQKQASTNKDCWNNFTASNQELNDIWREIEQLEERKQKLKKQYEAIQEQKQKDAALHGRDKKVEQITGKLMICGKIEPVERDGKCANCSHEIRKGNVAVVMKCGRCVYHRRCFCQLISRETAVCSCSCALMEFQ